MNLFPLPHFIVLDLKVENSPLEASHWDISRKENRIIFWNQFLLNYQVGTDCLCI